MSITRKFFFLIPFALSITMHAIGQTPGDAEVSWYESFFRKKHNHEPVDQLLATVKNRLQLARDRNDMPTVARSLNELGLIHLTRTSVYDQAIDALMRALAVEDSVDLKQEKIFTYLTMAQVFEKVDNFYKSAELIQDALLLNEDTKNVHILVLLLNESGSVHAAMGQLDEARENYEQVLEYKDDVQPAVEATALVNLAHLYQQQMKYSEALADYKKSLTISRAAKDREREARTLNDIAGLYHVMKKDDKALANHIAAMEIRKALKDQNGLAESYNNIGILYYLSNNTQRAVDNLDLALTAAREAQDQNQIQRSYEYLSLCYARVNDYKKALYYKDQYIEINDFIRTEENTQQLLETQTRYVIDRKEIQIEKLLADSKQRERELENQKKFRNILMALIILSLVIAALVLYLYISKRRSNKILQAANDTVQHQNTELQELNATKDKFFSIISHDLKGPLNSLTSFSGLLINHFNSLSKEDIQTLAKDLDKSLKNLFALLENLLEWSRSQTGNIEFKPEKFDLHALLNENIELLRGQAQTKSITVEQTSNETTIVYAHRNSINTVVRNLVSNAIKFTPVGGKITLGIKPEGDYIVTSISDTGVGMSPEVISKLFRIDTKHSTKGTANEKGTGLGLILCKEFVEKNGGRIWVTSEPEHGSVFSFSLMR